MKNTNVRCAVSGFNVGGLPDFYFATVYLSDEQLDSVIHINAVRNQAESLGFDVGIAYDEFDFPTLMEINPNLSRPEFIYLDSGGNIIKVGSSVDVPTPDETDIHNHDFTGTVKKFRNGNVIVCDNEGNCFEIESFRLALDGSCFREAVRQDIAITEYLRKI